jgi:hypothetical protein
MTFYTDDTEEALMQAAFEQGLKTRKNPFKEKHLKEACDKGIKHAEQLREQTR